MQLTAPDPELWRTQRRARFLLAAGAGLAAGSAVHLAWASRDRRCTSDHVMNNGLYTAGFLGSVGVTMAIGGGTWLGVSAKRHGYLRASPGQTWAAAAFALAGFAGATFFTTVVRALDGAGCSS